jgi:hypothetical protein
MTRKRKVESDFDDRRKRTGLSHHEGWVVRIVACDRLRLVDEVRVGAKAEILGLIGAVETELGVGDAAGTVITLEAIVEGRVVEGGR